MNLTELVKDTQSAILEHAKLYVEQGLPVIPLTPANSPKSSPGKVPIVSGWVSKSFTSEEELEEWSKKFVYFNIGMPLGDASGYVAIDIDGDVGIKILKEVSNGDLPKTWEYTTGNGHRLLYRLPLGVITKKKAIKGDGKHQECSFLVSGQQTVLPPSVHSSGELYQWVKGNTPEDIDCGDAPAWLVRQVVVGEENSFESEMQFTPFDPSMPGEMASSNLTKTEAKKRAKFSLNASGRTGRKVTREDWKKDITEGGRNNHITMLVGSIISKGLPKKMVEQSIHTYNEDHCKPPLPKDEVQLLIDNLYELDTTKRQEMGIESLPTTYVPNKFLAPFQRECERRGVTFQYDYASGRFYYYKQEWGFWRPVDTEHIAIDRIVRDVISNVEYGGNPKWDSSSYVREFYEKFKSTFPVPFDVDVSPFDIGANSHKHLDHVNVKNGMLNWRTGELEPHDPSYMSTIQLRVEYDPKAKATFWEKTLRDWVPDKRTRMVLQEYIGLSLLPDTSYRKALFLHGGGRNGKSLFIDTIDLLFKGNSSSYTIAEIGERFTSRYLQDKLINIAGELDKERILKTSKIKAIIAGDKIKGEVKSGAVYRFTPVCRLIFASNHLPLSNESNVGWLSRLIIVPFKQQFEVDPHFKKEFEKNVHGEELPGLFNWAVEGLRRLEKNGEFTESTEIANQQEEYMRSNDPIYEFLGRVVRRVKADDLEYTKDGAVPTSYLYHLYQDWCDMYGVKFQVNVRDFNNQVEMYGYSKTRSGHRIQAHGGRKVAKSSTTCWMNMGFNITADIFQENPLFQTEVQKLVDIS